MGNMKTQKSVCKLDCEREVVRLGVHGTGYREN
jgi:hypothetical protein